MIGIGYEEIDRLARSTADLYRIISELAERGVAFKVVDAPTVDTTSRTGKLIMGILALIAEFENDIRRERQQDGINKALERGVRFGRKPFLTDKVIATIRDLRAAGNTVPEIIRQTNLSKASIYRALGGRDSSCSIGAATPDTGFRRMDPGLISQISSHLQLTLLPKPGGGKLWD